MEHVEVEVQDGTLGLFVDRLRVDLNAVRVRFDDVRIDLDLKLIFRKWMIVVDGEGRR